MRVPKPNSAGRWVCNVTVAQVHWRNLPKALLRCDDVEGIRRIRGTAKVQKVPQGLEPLGQVNGVIEAIKYRDASAPAFPERERLERREGVENPLQHGQSDGTSPHLDR